MGVTQRQQELAAAGVHVQNTAVGPQGGQNFGFIIPGQNVFLGVAAVQMGKIPAMDVCHGLFGQPLFF